MYGIYIRRLTDMSAPHRSCSTLKRVRLAKHVYSEPGRVGKPLKASVGHAAHPSKASALAKLHRVPTHPNVRTYREHAPHFSYPPETTGRRARRQSSYPRWELATCDPRAALLVPELDELVPENAALLPPPLLAFAWGDGPWDGPPPGV